MARDGDGRTSRRVLLSAGLAGLISTLLPWARRSARAETAPDGSLVLGADNEATSPTTVTLTTAGTNLLAEAPGPGVGLMGTSEAGIGVYGLTENGFGVLGSSVAGSGVEAVSPDGVALRIRRGRFRADGISGVATIPVGSSYTSIEPAVRMPRDAFVLLTPMMDLGARRLWARTAPEDNLLSIHVSSPSDDEALVIAWLLLN